MNDQLKNIALIESFIIGWKITNNNLILYMEFLLTKDHENYLEFDSKYEFGCYKLGLFNFLNFTNLSGINDENFCPEWDNKLNEYKDIEEINSFELLNDYIKIYTDSKIIGLNFNAFKIEFLKTGEKFDAHV